MPECWSIYCDVNNDTVRPYDQFGQFCPKHLDEQWNNYELVCISCNKRYVIVYRDHLGLDRHCRKCFDEIMESHKYVW